MTKNPLPMQKDAETWVLGQSLEKEMAVHSGILVGKFYE